ncbi:MAG: SMI1/KNR4 family protein [Rhodospirillales bacterium]|nr:SMI1/KNR4 family protein [Rhodospirillales bacterium]
MYEFLRRYVNVKDGPNSFVPVTQNEILEAEKRIGLSLPEQLQTFYTEIGCGFLKAPRDSDLSDEKWFDNINRVVGPSEIADLYLGVAAWGPAEGFLPGLVSFFDVGDDTYLVLKIKEPCDSAVYWPNGKRKVADTLEEFFIRLHENPSFYLNAQGR